MRSKPSKDHFVDLVHCAGSDGREDCQSGWHNHVARMHFETVLDVGAGLGFSKFRIPYCYTQDPGPGTDVDFHCAITEFPSGSFDAVTAFDVIEHVVEDVDFLLQLCRIARKWVFITTPNLDVSHAENGCHCREYSPKELADLASSVEGWEPYRGGMFAGSSVGDDVEWLRWNDFLIHTRPHHAFLLGKR